MGIKEADTKAQSAEVMARVRRCKGAGLSFCVVGALLLVAIGQLGLISVSSLGNGSLSDVTTTANGSKLGASGPQQSNPRSQASARISLRAGESGALSSKVGLNTGLATSPGGAQATLASLAGSPVRITVDTSHPGQLINRDLLGVDGPDSAAPAVVSELTALHLRYVRTDVSFQGSYDGKPVYNCATGGWNPIPLDTTVKEIEAIGATSELIVDYTPSCLANMPQIGATYSQYEPPDLGANQPKWDALVYQMAYHEITAEGVRIFEIWNEPDGEFWFGGLAGYLHLYADTATVLERAAAAAHTHIEVGGPALLAADPTWIEPFLAFVAKNHLPLSFLSWHWYASDPMIGPVGPIPMPPKGTPPYWYDPALSAKSYGEQVAAVRAMLASFPSLHPKLWIDEWNVGVGYDARNGQPFDAAFAAAVLDSAQTSGLDRMCFFDAWNPQGSGGGGFAAAESNQGLLAPNFTPQPVYYTFAFWSAMAQREVPVTLSPAQTSSRPSGRVGAVASVGPHGRVTVLAYNFMAYSPTGNYGTSDPNPYDRIVTVALSGLKRSRTYNWTQALVDAVHNGSVVGHGTLKGPSGQLSFTLPGEGVTLITLTP